VKVGTSLTGNRGKWNGTQPIVYRYQWQRCNGDGLVCQKIADASETEYTATADDTGRTIRFRVTATNNDGEDSALSNPTAQIASAAGAPEAAALPSVSGDAVVGSELTATSGTWVGKKPITYAFRWQACDREITSCENTGKTSATYTVAKADVDKRLRAKVVAKNSAGETAALSDPTEVVKAGGQSGSSGVVTLPSGEKSVSVTAVPKGERLIVDQVRFSPNPVTSRDRPIHIEIRVTDTQHHVVRGALVFVRSTPLVASVPTDAPTATDGWIAYDVQPEADFPLKNGYSVQFFVKAYRQGDPTLAGISGTRLVQVATAGP
jgi:hypothetical protein